MLNELAGRIWANPRFQQELLTLVAARVRRSTLGDATPDGAEALDEGTLARLLQSAAVLAQSAAPPHKEAAYRIATAMYTLYAEAYDRLPQLLYVVLSRLGNFPAIEFSRGSVHAPEGLPLPVAIEAGHRLIGNTVTVRRTPLGSSEIVLTDFQRNVWSALDEGASLGASAPTSAGKSFLLQAFIRRLWAAPPRPRVVYIVPTRALINQVSGELVAALRSDGTDEVGVVTVPLAADQPVPADALFVMTQERLQLILTNHPDAAFDLVIVDEAQAIGDGGRGVILTAVLEELTRRNAAVQMFFASPNVSNPQIFGRLFGLKNYRHHKSRDIAVAQNLIHLDTAGADPRRVRVSLSMGGAKQPLGELTTDDDLTGVKQATVHLANLFGQSGQSLVYAKGPADCQSLATGLMQLETARAEAAGSPEPSAERRQLSAFVKESVHPKYALAETVLSGVGFHYGAMPPLLRRSIEDAFRGGELKFLVSTSTLLHGLNLPARSLFLNRPRRGNETPLGPVDFWNLAGRAGRLGKEFEGDVYLIDYDQWPSQPLAGEREVAIRPTLEEHVHERADELITYIGDPDRKPDRSGTDEFENTFTKLYGDHRAGHLGETLDRLEVPPQSEVRVDLSKALREAERLVRLEDDVVRASPTVSVYRQQRLYDYMLAKIAKKGPEYLMPVHPLSPGAYESLVAIFKRCHTHIFQWPTGDKRHLRAAVFAHPWMRGDPLPQIIDAHFDYELKRNEGYTIAKAILTTLKTIEEEVRFTYVRLTGCYNTLLKRALIAKSYTELAERIVPIPMFMEVGACSQTMMSFIGMGLSRISARTLAREAARQNMGPVEAKAWVQTQDLDVLGMSPIIIKEIKRALQAA